MKLKHTATVFACLAGVLAFAAADARADNEIYGLPLYPSISSAPFKGELSTNDIPLNAVVLSTKDDLDVVISYYEKAIEERGHTVAKHMFSPALGYVGYFDKDSRTMRMATMFRTPKGRTMIVLSTMDPRPLLLDTPVPADLPSLSGATGVVKTEGKEAGRTQRTVSYRLPGVQPGQARTRLLEAAGKLGWEHDDQDLSYGRQTAVLKRGGEICVLKIHPDKKRMNGNVSTSVSMVVFDTANR